MGLDWPLEHVMTKLVCGSLTYMTCAIGRRSLLIRAQEGHVFRSCFLPCSAAGVASSSGRRAGAKYHIIIIISSATSAPSVRPRPPLLPGSIGCGPRPTGDPPDNQSHRSVAPSCARRSPVGRRSRVNRRQLHIARLPPGARRSDACSRANVALLPCRIPRNLCHVGESDSVVGCRGRSKWCKDEH